MAGKKEKDPGFSDWITDKRKEVEKIPDEAKRNAWKLALEDEDQARDVFRAGIREQKLYSELNAINDQRQKLSAEQNEWRAWHAEVKTRAAEIENENKVLKDELESRKRALKAAALDDDAADIDNSVAARKREAEFEDIKKKLAALEASSAKHEDQIPKLYAGSPAFTAMFVQKSEEMRDAGLKVNHEEVLGRIIKGAPIALAFEEEVRTQRDAQRDKAIEERIAKAKKEAYEEAMTQRSAPDAVRSTAGFFGSQGTQSSAPGDKLAAARAAALKDAANFGRAA